MTFEGIWRFLRFFRVFFQGKCRAFWDLAGSLLRMNDHAALPPKPARKRKARASTSVPYRVKDTE